MHKRFFVPLVGAFTLVGCNQQPPTPRLPKPIQPPVRVEVDMQQLIETAEKELAPVDQPSFAPTPPATQPEE